MSKVKIIVGLGNLDKKYENTRHNVGAWFVSSIAKEKGKVLKKNSKLNCYITKVNIANNSTLLVFPSTFMNNSGLAVSNVINFYKVKIYEILIVHDELNINTGLVKLKKGGGHGGHNGLRSINEHLGANDYLRLRIGIDHPGDKLQVANYVLSKPSAIEKQLINKSINNAMNSIDDIINGNIESAMQRLNIK